LCRDKQNHTIGGPGGMPNRNILCSLSFRSLLLPVRE
jgi:hypothetical protein